MDFDEINEKTGFANGDLFNNESEIIAYFTVENMNMMFGYNHGLIQQELDEMAKIVIKNNWHFN